MPDKRISAILLLSTFTIGCASSSAPHGWLREAEEAQSQHRGAWTEIEPVEKSISAHKVTIANVWLRVSLHEKPDNRSKVLGELMGGSKILVDKTVGRWAQVAYSAYGEGWVDVKRIEISRNQRSIHGELLAIDEDSIYVLDICGVHAVALRDLRVARTMMYDSNYESLAGWTLLGVASTVLNGWLLFITAPIYLIFGFVSTIDQSYEPYRSYPKDDLRIQARFPQGMPPDFPRNVPLDFPAQQ